MASWETEVHDVTRDRQQLAELEGHGDEMRAILVFDRRGHTSEVATCSRPLMQAMCADEIEHHGGVLFV